MAPPPAADPSPSGAHAPLAAPLEDADDEDAARRREEAAAERRRRGEVAKAKVAAARAALDSRKKVVSVRAPDVVVDPDAAQHRLFGSDKAAAAAAPAAASAAAAAAAAAPRDSDDDDAAADDHDGAGSESSSSAVVGRREGEARDLADAALDIVPADQPLATLLHPRLSRAVEAMGISKLTRVQRLSWRAMVADGDVLIRSETGSGKTLAYGLPMLHALLTRCDKQPIDRSTGTVALVMAPTRELAEQCSSVLTKCLHKAAFVIVGAVHGGEDRHKEKARLRKGVHVLVCTPGRLLDHLQSTAAFGHDHLHTIVMDEADRLLDMGFEKAITSIMGYLHPTKRVLVSATITAAVERLSHFALKQPATRVGETEDKYEVPASLRQHYTVVPCKHRLPALTAVLAAQLEAAARKIVVFVSTADATEFLYLLYSRLASPFERKRGAAAAAAGGEGATLSKGAAAALQRRGGGQKKLMQQANRHVYEGGDASEGMTGGDSGLEGALAAAKNAASRALAEQAGQATSLTGNLAEDDALVKCNVFKLHGNMTQVDRSAVFNAFRDCEKGVLFCTDVAARGLDMPAISWIVHYDPPADDRCYVHRIGRTARIGKAGDSLLFLMEHEAEFVTEYLKDVTSSAIREKPLPVIMYHLSRLNGDAASWADSAATVQRAAATLVRYDQVLNRVALFAYRSFIRSYATYPRELRAYFDQSKLHLGHVAASFALDATPAELRRQTRRYAEEDRAIGRDGERLKKQGNQIQLDTRERYHSTLATKAVRDTKNWLVAREADASRYKSVSGSKMAEFDAE